MTCLTFLILEGFAWLLALSHKLSDFYACLQLFNNSYCRAATNPPTFTAPSGSLDLASEERSPFVVKNGQYSQLNSHHSKQDGLGSLFELSAHAHQKFGKTNALHFHLLGQHPINDVDRDLFNGDREAYWKGRAQSEVKSKNSNGSRGTAKCG